MTRDKKEFGSFVSAAFWVALAIIFISCLGCAPTQQRVQLVPVSEDTYVRLQQLEIQRQRAANDYRADVIQSYSRERSEIRRIQADIERDERRYQAQAEEDRRDAARDFLENLQDRAADAARDRRDLTRDVAPQIYKDVRREWRRRH